MSYALLGYSKRHFKRLVGKELNGLKTVDEEAPKDSTNRSNLCSDTENVEVNGDHLKNEGHEEEFLTKAEQKEMFCNLDEENNQLKAKCAKLESENEEQTKFLKELRADISQLKTDVTTIKNSTGSQGVILEKLVQKVLPKMSNLTILPFKTIEEIKSADNILSQYPRDELVTYVCNTVGVTTIRKIVPFLFAESTMPFINWDGRHQRFAIKSLNFFNEIVFREVQGPDMDFSKFDSEMRKGIRSAKNKMYKNKSNQP